MSVRRYIELAHKVAMLSECSVQHGALIYRGGNILSVACNRRVTHPVSMKWSDDPKKITTVHAEQRALTLCQSDVSGATLVSVRLNGDRRSKPCRMCAALMYDAGIHSVIYFINPHEYVKIRLKG